jgi:flagellar basal-body rod protein FlgB
MEGTATGGAHALTDGHNFCLTHIVIDGLTNSEAIPVLERLMQFAGQRHRILSNNIANLSTPGFRPGDVSVKDFQAQLAKAIDARRSPHAETSGELQLASTGQVEVLQTGLRLNPTAIGDNLLFHDQNDRDVERTMQGLVENFMAFRSAAQLLRSRFDLLNTAIRERL